MKMTIIPHDIIKSPKIEQNRERYENNNNGGYPCCICGKEIKDNGDYFLHLFDGGGLLTDFCDDFPEELQKRDHRFSSAGDMLCYPVGATCYRKWLKMKKSGKYDEEV